MSKTKQHTFRAPLRSHPMPLLFNYLTIHRFKGNSGTTPCRLWDGFWDDLNLQNHSVLPSLGRRDGSKGSKGIYPRPPPRHSPIKDEELLNIQCSMNLNRF